MSLTGGRAEALVAFQKACGELRAEWGIVLGSGLSSVAEDAEAVAELSYGDVPGLPQSAVAGHDGRFVLVRLGAASLLVARGRVHLYEGHSATAVTAGIHFMAECGVKRLILTNAAGTLNRRHPPGSWMTISDHINLTGASPLTGGPHFLDMSEVYSKRLRELFKKAAMEDGMPLHAGIYAGVAGPQYETPAEVRMLSRLGADAVGMSTVLEAIQARALGMEVAAFSCLANWAAGLSPAPLGHVDVLATGASAAEQFQRLLSRAVAMPA